MIPQAFTFLSMGTGEPDTSKVVCPVRGGIGRKGSNDLARGLPYLVPRCGHWRRLRPGVRLHQISMETAMRGSTIDIVVILVLSLLVAPLAAETQPAGKVYRIGILMLGPYPSEAQRQQLPFLQGLRELGWHEGQNLVIERRYAEGEIDRLPARAAELVGLKVDLIVAAGAIAIRAAQHATSTIPIVMAGTSDAVRAGFVASLAQPGGNITGVSNMTTVLIAKRLELLEEAVPGLSRVAVLAAPATPYTPTTVSEAELAARTLGA